MEFHEERGMRQRCANMIFFLHGVRAICGTVHVWVENSQAFFVH